MSEQQSESASSSSSGVDYVLLCEDIVQRIYGVVKRGKLLNGRQCKFLADYLSREILGVEHVARTRNRSNMDPLLGALHRYYEKAEVLVKQCAEEDWCAAAVFQGSNDLSILNIGSCVYSIILELAFWNKHARKTVTGMMDKHHENFPDSLMPADADREDLRQRLEGLVSERSIRSTWMFTKKAALKQHRAQHAQHLARYLLKKKKFQLEHTTTGITLEALKSILWEKDDEPRGTWGEVKFLGCGSGASGVLKTSWLGIPCAKKEFHAEASESMFMKEALIMARLKMHPCIVDFICCGNGERKGDRFIAMELMEKSLYDLIKERKGVHFSLEVVLDIIWQIAEGVRFLHEHGVAHRDLKSQNVLVRTLRSPYYEDYYCVKLADFGTCKSEVEVSTSYKASYPGVGTTRYRAPEVFPNAHSERLGTVDWFKADAYSFAMTCAHVLTMKQPFEDMEVLSELYAELVNGRRPILSNSVCPGELVELMEKCWSNSRSGRPNFGEIESSLRELRFYMMDNGN